MNKSFILGIGSQRAGSTFLAKFLGRHPKIRMHPIKELHYFDTLFGKTKSVDLVSHRQRSLARKIDALRLRKGEEPVMSDWSWDMRIEQELATRTISEIEYDQLFAEAGDEKGVEFFGEVTPEYMLLEEEYLVKVRETVPNAYIIMMCRNPARRVASAFRLFMTQKNFPEEQQARDDLFLKYLGSGAWIARQQKLNDYQGAYERYRKVFDRVLALPYDDIIEDPIKMIKTLEHFLRIDFDAKKMSPFFKRKFNVSRIDYSPGPQVVAHLEAMFARQLDRGESFLGRKLRH